MHPQPAPVVGFHPTGLTAADHAIGDEDAPFTLLEYGDYECPASAEAETKVRHLVKTFGPQLRFVFRHLPHLELQPHSELAAEAAEAAAAQGKFWEMHRLLFGAPNHLSLANLTKHAQSIDLDMTRFQVEMADRTHTQWVQEHRRAAKLSNLYTTPAFILNDKLIDTSSGLEKLEAAVHALERPHV